MKHIKILSLGDESLRVAFNYLPKIAKCDSVGVVSGILSVKDTVGESFFEKISNDSDELTFVYNNEGSVRFNTMENFSATKVFDWFSWDFVVIGDSFCEKDAVEELCAFVKAHSPETSVVIRSECGKNDLYRNADIIISVAEVAGDFEKELADRKTVADVNSSRIKDFLNACVLYEMLTGNNVSKNKYRLPFVESEITEIIKNVVHRNIAKS